MDLATYCVSHVRAMLGDSHPVVESVKFRTMSQSQYQYRDKSQEDLEQIDEAVTATFKSKTGAVGILDADLSLSGRFLGMKVPSLGWPKCVAELEENFRALLLPSTTPQSSL